MPFNPTCQLTSGVEVLAHGNDVGGPSSFGVWSISDVKFADEECSAEPALSLIHTEVVRISIHGMPFS